MDTILMVGTRKGLWVGRSDEARTTWTWTGPHFDMMEVYSCLIDVRGGRPRLFAGASSPWTGPQIQVSDDLGATWTPTRGAHFPDDVDASVERIWQLVPGTADGVLYAGTEPGAVFRS
ncbi:MAG: exo-alpha-sialidase, partial [Microbacterium sp.]